MVQFHAELLLLKVYHGRLRKGNWGQMIFPSFHFDSTVKMADNNPVFENVSGTAGLFDHSKMMTRSEWHLPDIS